MRTESSYPTPIYGVSTLSPRHRMKGQVEVQDNFRSDPLNRLTRRPPLVQYSTSKIAENIDIDDVFHHRYDRDGKTYRIVIDKSDGSVFAHVDTQPWAVVGNLSEYIGENLVAQTIDHKTYILNKDKIVEMKETNDSETVRKVSHINVTAALAYGESVKVNIIKSDGTKHIVEYTVPDLIASGNPEDPPDYDTADKARATNEVALQIAALINGGQVYPSRIPNPAYPAVPQNDSAWLNACREYTETGLNPNYSPTASICQPFLVSASAISGVTAVALGSTVAIWEDLEEDWLDVEIETGQGDRSCVPINRTIENIDGLPLYAVVGTRIQVKPDPTTEKGSYYLEAERTSDEASGEPMEEVVWVETRSPTVRYEIDKDTMPHVIEFTDGPELFDSEFVVSSEEWKSRQVGDEDSVPDPKFIGNTISDIGYFHKRLVFLTNNYAVMSETDDELNFWKQSAVKLLVNDTVSISSSATGTDKLIHIVPHNRDLLIMSSNGQFKINGSNAITPETVSMTLATKYDCDVGIKPVAMGNSVMFPIDYGESAGIQEYTAEKDTSQDFATPITHHVIGYMPGRAKQLVASPNLEMLAFRTTGCHSRQVFIYEQYTDPSGKRLHQSWSEWNFAGGAEIIDLNFVNDTLEVIVKENDIIYRKEVKLYSRVTTGVAEVYLDDLITTSTNGTDVLLSEDYVIDDDVVCIRGDFTKNEFFKVNYTQQGNKLYFDEDIGAGRVYLGRPYTSTFVPTRPFRYQEDGQVITTDRLRVSRFILSLSETNEIKMKINSKYYETEDQVFNSRFIDGLDNKLGEVPFFTGDYTFSFAQDANLATAEFYCDNWLGCTISSISWEGQYYESKRRM